MAFLLQWRWKIGWFKGNTLFPYCLPSYPVFHTCKCNFIHLTNRCWSFADRGELESQHYPCYFCFNQTGCLLKKLAYWWYFWFVLMPMLVWSYPVTCFLRPCSWTCFCLQDLPVWPSFLIIGLWILACSFWIYVLALDCCLLAWPLPASISHKPVVPWVLQ